MVLKGFPDWVQYNKEQVEKGRPKVSWPEFNRLKRHAKARLEAQLGFIRGQIPGDRVNYELGPTGLEVALHGHGIKLLPPPKETPDARPEASQGLSEDTLSPEGDDGTSCLELTPDMEVLDGAEVMDKPGMYDASGLIGSI